MIFETTLLKKNTRRYPLKDFINIGKSTFRVRALNRSQYIKAELKNEAKIIFSAKLQRLVDAHMNAHKNNVSAHTLEFSFEII
ncbi:MAG: hypothetical protein K6F39_03250 [Lachnospiraceae bacterium]|nr:hypothetical protein [Lachnospiraceae bacterium]